MLPVEKGVPIPAPVGVGRPRLYPWDEMQVGDSFAIPLNGLSVGVVRARLVASAANAQRRIPGFRIITAVDAVAIRAWRVA